MFHFHSIRWRITVTYTILTAVILIGRFLFFSSQIRADNLERLHRQLTTHALLLSNDHELRLDLAASRWQPGDDELAHLISAWATLLAARITLIRPDGVVLADSEADPLSMGNLSHQPEFSAALSAGTGYSNRFSRTFGSEMRYVAAAVPLPAADLAGQRPAASLQEPVGVLRLSVPPADGVATPSPPTIFAAILLALLAGAVVALFLAERTARPIRQLIHTATRMAQGDVGRIAPSSSDEVGQLIRAFNRMADRLETQVTSGTRERERLISVMDNLVDGVFILDNEGRVRLCNLVAAQMVGIEMPQPEQMGAVADAPFDRVRGLPLAQVVRDHRIVETWQTCQDDDKQAESIVQWGERTVRAIALPFVAGGIDGYIMLLQDMTDLYRLERVRRDFVSNISHELRTPLASLRALTETLRDGAWDDPEAASLFLDRIETEVDALAQMVQELLELSRIESGQVPFRFRPVPVSEIDRKSVV